MQGKLAVKNGRLTKSSKNGLKRLALKALQTSPAPDAAEDCPAATGSGNSPAAKEASPSPAAREIGSSPAGMVVGSSPAAEEKGNSPAANSNCNSPAAERHSHSLAAAGTCRSPSRGSSPHSSKPKGRDQAAAPEAADEAAMEVLSSSNHSSMSQQADASLPVSPGPRRRQLQPDKQKSASPLSSMSAGDSLEEGDSMTIPGTSQTTAGDAAQPQSSKAVSHSMPKHIPSKHAVNASALFHQDSLSGPENAGPQQGGLTPHKRPIPTKATPSKRFREVASNSPAVGSPTMRAGDDTGVEGVKEGTPGKRRRSLLPLAPQKDGAQVNLHVSASGQHCVAFPCCTDLCSCP